jgi:hypothetical protein
MGKFRLATLPHNTAVNIDFNTVFAYGRVVQP